MDQQAQRFLS